MTRRLGVSEGDESRSRQLWDFQTGLASELYRVFDTGWERVPKIKHVIRPEISYLYIPDVNQSNIPYYDQAVPKTNAIFYGITNRVIGKIVEKSQTRYQEYLYFKIGQTYDINEATRSLGPSSEPRRPFGLITSELRLKGLRYVEMENITGYNPNKGEFDTSYTTAGLSDGRGDSLYLEHIWRKGIEEQIYGNLLIRVLSSLDLSFGKRYSLFTHQPLDTTYGLIYRHQCWGLNLTYQETPTVSGAPAEKKIWFMFTLTGVGQVGTQ